MSIHYRNNGAAVIRQLQPTLSKFLRHVGSRELRDVVMNTTHKPAFVKKKNGSDMYQPRFYFGVSKLFIRIAILDLAFVNLLNKEDVDRVIKLCLTLKSWVNHEAEYASAIARFSKLESIQFVAGDGTSDMQVTDDGSLRRRILHDTEHIWKRRNHDIPFPAISFTLVKAQIARKWGIDELIY